MEILKLSLIILFTTQSFAFSGTQCFEDSFDVSVTHKSFPFGLLTKTLSISKKGCELKISHNQYKYFNSQWKVDICRDPIHIKTEVGSIEVYRKIEKCTSIKSDFCNEYKKLSKIIENDGLIFAQGLKSDITSNHGRVYCTYSLLQEYLNKDKVFNIGQNYDYIMKKINSGNISNSEGNPIFQIDPESGKADF